jgi:uncharacterized protein YjbJ (UPF0337 family)
MAFTDKVKNKVEEAVGTAKEKIGQATGNDKLVAEGKAEKTEAGVKQTGEKVKDAAGEAADTVRDHLKK